MSQIKGDNMSNTLNTNHSIVINAPAETVWAALTTPHMIKQWFMGVNTRTDWSVGSPIVHTGEYQGKPYEDRGKILRFEPNKVLSHTHWSVGSGRPDHPENYQTVTYTLTPQGSSTELTISEYNLPSDEAKATSEKTWEMVINTLKELLEKQPA